MAQSQEVVKLKVIKQLLETVETLRKGCKPTEEMINAIQWTIEALDLIYRNVNFFTNEMIKACERGNKEDVVHIANRLKQIIIDLLS